MLIKDVYTEEVLIGAGVNPDSAWDLGRLMLNSFPDVDIPDDYVIEPKYLASLYNLVGNDPERICQFLSILGTTATERVSKNLDDTSQAPKIIVISRALSLLTAQFFDEEMEEKAKNIVAKVGGSVDSVKCQQYWQYGIVPNLVGLDELPTSRARLVRLLTNIAFLDGFTPDFDTSPTMQLIKEKPDRVKQLVRLGLSGETLRAYCTLIVDGGLTREAIRERYPHFSDRDSKEVFSAVEPLAYLLIGLTIKRKEGDEKSRFASIEQILSIILDAYAEYTGDEVGAVIGCIFQEQFTDQELIDFLCPDNDGSATIEDASKKMNENFFTDIKFS